MDMNFDYDKSMMEFSEGEVYLLNCGAKNKGIDVADYIKILLTTNTCDKCGRIFKLCCEWCVPCNKVEIMLTEAQISTLEMLGDYEDVIKDHLFNITKVCNKCGAKYVGLECKCMK